MTYTRSHTALSLVLWAGTTTLATPAFAEDIAPVPEARAVTQEAGSDTPSRPALIAPKPVKETAGDPDAEPAPPGEPEADPVPVDPDARDATPVTPPAAPKRVALADDSQDESEHETLPDYSHLDQGAVETTPAHPMESSRSSLARQDEERRQDEPVERQDAMTTRVANVPADAPAAGGYYSARRDDYERGYPARPYFDSAYPRQAYGYAMAAERADSEDRYVRSTSNRSYGDYRVSGGFDRAVDDCANELSRSGRVLAGVDGIRRMADLFRVEGVLRNGADYACDAGADGHIRSLAINGRPIF